MTFNISITRISCTHIYAIYLKGHIKYMYKSQKYIKFGKSLCMKIMWDGPDKSLTRKAPKTYIPA